jgi:hypothetical protein
LTTRFACKAALPTIIYGATLAAIFLTGQTPELENAIRHDPVSLPFLLSFVFGDVQKYIFFFLILCAWSFIPGRSDRCFFLSSTLFWLILPLNPLFPHIFARLVSSDIAWREMWVIPFWGLATVGVWGCASGMARYFSTYCRHYVGLFTVLAVFTAALLPYANLRSSNIERLGFDTRYYPIRYAPVLDAVRKYVPARQIIVGPHDVSQWLTTLPEDYSVHTYRHHALAPDGSANERHEVKHLLGLGQATPDEITTLEKILMKIRPIAVLTHLENEDIFRRMGFVKIFEHSGMKLYVATQHR